MGLDKLLNVGWSGIWLGCQFAAIGLGLVLSFRAARVINLSLGALFVFTALLAATLQAKGWPASSAALLAVAVGLALSLAQEHFLLRRLEGVTPSILLLATLAVATTLSGLSAVFFGRDPLTGKGLVASGEMAVGGWHATWNSIVFVGLITALALAVWLFAARSTWGKAMGAAGDDPGAARMLGIDIWRLRLTGLGLAGLVVSAAGVVSLPLNVVDFSLGLRFTLFGFVAAAALGYESAPGALIGGLVFGLLDAYGTAYVSSIFAQAITFGALIALVVAARRLGVMPSIS